MRIVLHAGIWLMGLLLPVGMWAQTVPTTNEVRAMRGLGAVQQAGLPRRAPALAAEFPERMRERLRFARGYRYPPAVDPPYPTLFG